MKGHSTPFPTRQGWRRFNPATFGVPLLQPGEECTPQSGRGQAAPAGGRIIIGSLRLLPEEAPLDKLQNVFVAEVRWPMTNITNHMNNFGDGNRWKNSVFRKESNMLSAILLILWYLGLFTGYTIAGGLIFCWSFPSPCYWSSLFKEKILKRFIPYKRDIISVIAGKLLLEIKKPTFKSKI